MIHVNKIQDASASWQAPEVWRYGINVEVEIEIEEKIFPEIYS
jgi:hypothetical protein